MSDDEGTIVRKKTTKKTIKVEDDDEAPIVKKSKKTVVADDDEDAGVARKSKKAVAADDDEGEVVVKKSKKAAAADGEEGEKRVGREKRRHADPNENGEGDAMGADASLASTFKRYDYDSMSYTDFTKLLKSKSKTERLREKAEFDEFQLSEENKKKNEPILENFTDLTGGYSYTNLLERAFVTIRSKNPTSSERAKLPRPKVEKVGSKRTAITNFGDMCAALNRPLDDVRDFIQKQLTTQSSVDQNNRLIIKIQNVKEAQIETLLAEFIKDFVKCNSCHRLDTNQIKDSNRLFTLTCNNCGASRSVAPAAGATFQAQTTKRARQKAKLQALS